ncbi:MAG: DNA starvation/stationary phase protection protein [Bifidobacteriaceae bacterium]|jgi:starvation-inducible DNA-binding protein|nr:DNA starvation/stationary phase protection protein [Bifidobacteriaceae bacterium]
MTSPRTNPILQAALVDLIDLSLVAKQAHWNVRGANFRSVHLELDEIIDQVRVNSDDVAERLAAVGGSPDGRAATVAATSQVPTIEPGPIEAGAVVADFSQRISQAARRIETSLPELDEDMPSQDLLTGIVGELDKAAWMLRSQVAA